MWDSSHSAWQAAAGAAWVASQWRGAEGADVMRERAISVAEVTQLGFTGLSFHTSRYIDGIACPPLIFIMFICTILLFLLLAINLSFLVWPWYDKKSTVARLRALRDKQCDPAPVEGVAPTEVLTAFPADFTSWEEIPHFTVMLFLDFDGAYPEGTLQLLSWT